MLKGKFIVLEGIDGSGKSTVARLVAEKIQEHGDKVLHTGTSSGAISGSVISKFISDELLTGNEANLSEETQGLLFASLINDLLDNLIIPAINDKHFVICERYTLSAKCYQGDTPVTRAALKAIDDKRTPDLTFVLDVPPEVGIARSGNDYLESVSNHVIAHRRTLYRRLARLRENTHVLDATMPPEVIADAIIDKVYIYAKRLVAAG